MMPTDRAEQPDERRDARGRRQKRDAAFQLVHFHHRRAHQRAIDGRQALQSRTCRARLLDWARRSRRASPAATGPSVRRSRTGTGRPAGSRRASGRPPGPPRTCCCGGRLRGSCCDLACRPAKHPQLVENDGPRADRQQREDQQHRLGDRRGSGDQAQNRRSRCSPDTAPPCACISRATNGLPSVRKLPSENQLCAAGTAPRGVPRTEVVPNCSTS